MTEKIAQKIINQTVLTDSKETKPDKLIPIEREDILLSTTYKTKTIDGIGFYITISDVVIDGVKRPYEFFVNTKEVDHFPYWIAIARLISAFFRTGYDYRFIAQELQEVFDPKGGYFKKGTLYNSFIAEVGVILEKHFEGLKNYNSEIKNI